MLVLTWQNAAAKPVTPVQPDKDKKAQDKPAGPATEKPQAPAEKPAEPKNNPARQPNPLGLPDFEQMFPKGTLDPNQEKQLKQQLDRVFNQLEKALQQAQGGAGQAQIKGGVVIRSGRENRLGANLTQPPEVLIEQLGLPRGQGLVLTGVKADSAAGKAGLKDNDILLELDGKKVSSQPAQFTKLLNEFKTGEKLNALVVRGGKQSVVEDIILPDAPRNSGINVRPIRPALPNLPLP
jgi:C-terminal processing protease CtpA/Prc